MAEQPQRLSFICPEIFRWTYCTPLVLEIGKGVLVTAAVQKEGPPLQHLAEHGIVLKVVGLIELEMFSGKQVSRRLPY